MTDDLHNLAARLAETGDVPEPLFDATPAPRRLAPHHEEQRHARQVHVARIRGELL